MVVAEIELFDFTPVLARDLKPGSVLFSRPSGYYTDYHRYRSTLHGGVMNDHSEHNHDKQKKDFPQRYGEYFAVLLMLLWQVVMATAVTLFVAVLVIAAGVFALYITCSMAFQSMH
ncbi:MAG TPA: hypothetical protein DIW81_17450 [Planctomycetaceae bacterium]|nr:hypothetical protein [Rubinisphaera sp.]HCS53350.1 hypothetical protein [Planctomycetaceae bacterium]